MESLKLSMREIKLKYTKSDLALQAWDSKQKSYNLRMQMTSPKDQSGKTSDKDIGIDKRSGVVEYEDSYELPHGVNSGVRIPKKFFNDDGELDLRRATGPEAVTYLRAIGINVLPALRL
jgi:hypothetical protein